MAGIAIVGFLGWQKWQYIVDATDGTGRDIGDLQNLWSAKEEITEAQEKLANSPQEALIITTDISNQPVVAIVIDGLPDRAATAKILDVLQKYDAKAAFFVEGQNAGENIETMKLLVESGQQIGNYTFVGISHAEKLPMDSLLAELCKTQKVINLQTQKTPVVFRAAQTNYTPELLKAVNAAGIEAAVKSNININLAAINSLNDAINIAAPIPLGSIIAIQIGKSVDIPQETGKKDERPAIDKKPTIKDPEEKKPQHTVENSLRIEWLLQALAQRGIKAVDVADFRKIKYIPAVPVQVPQVTPQANTQTLVP